MHTTMFLGLRSDFDVHTSTCQISGNEYQLTV